MNRAAPYELRKKFLVLQQEYLEFTVSNTEQVSDLLLGFPRDFLSQNQ